MPKKKLTKSTRKRVVPVATSKGSVGPAKCLRMVAWNVGHQTRRKPMHPRFQDAVAALDPDLLVLTEYVHEGVLRAQMLDDLRSLGLAHWRISDHFPRENGGQNNQVLAACRVPLHLGEIRGPVMQDRGAETNFLHVHPEGVALEVVGMRAPAYKDARSKRRFWGEFAAIASEAAGRQIAFVGDMNADPDSLRSIGGKTLLSLRDVGWHVPRPSGPRSFVKGGRIDHVLAWRALQEPAAYYVSRVDGIALMGRGRNAISDHAALVVDFPGMPRFPLVAKGQPSTNFAVAQPASETSDTGQEVSTDAGGTIKPRRFDDVRIEFLSATGADDAYATVIDREDAMVIELAEDGKPTYTIIGKKESYYYVGRDLNPPAGSPPVVARWALLGDVYVGIWREKPDEWLMSFQLPHSLR